MAPFRQICQVGGPGPVPSFSTKGLRLSGWGRPICLGESLKWFSASAWSPTPFPGPKHLGASEGFLQVVALKMGAGSCPLLPTQDGIPSPSLYP